MLPLLPLYHTINKLINEQGERKKKKKKGIRGFYTSPNFNSKIVTFSILSDHVIDLCKRCINR